MHIFMRCFRSCTELSFANSDCMYKSRGRNDIVLRVIWWFLNDHICGNPTATWKRIMRSQLHLIMPATYLKLKIPADSYLHREGKKSIKNIKYKWLYSRGRIRAVIIFNFPTKWSKQTPASCYSVSFSLWTLILSWLHLSRDGEPNHTSERNLNQYDQRCFMWCAEEMLVFSHASSPAENKDKCNLVDVPI